MPLSEQRKNALISMEWVHGFQGSTQNDIYLTETYSYSGQSCEIKKEISDESADEKAKCAKSAVRAIVNFGFELPYKLVFHCTNNGRAQNRAFHRDASWNPVGYVTLGRTALAKGRPDATSAMAIPGFTKGIITAIHEVGHIIHAQTLGDDFFATGTGLAGSASTAVKVSGYAGMSKKEFVAEVFAGIVIGRKFDNSVLEEYKSLGGPSQCLLW